MGVAALGDEVSGGLLKVPLLKAMFRELIGKKIRRLRETNELFLMGLLSVMDALLNVPMTQVLNETQWMKHQERFTGITEPVPADFDVVLDYKSGTWEQLVHSARAIGLGK